MSDFDTIAQLDFRDATTGRSLIARLGRPTQLPSGSWICRVRIDVERLPHLDQNAMGGDAFQAIIMGMRRLGLWFSQSDQTYDSTSGAPETVFPRFLPTSYGSDRYQDLCRLLEEKIEQWEIELSQSRRDRNS